MKVGYARISTTNQDTFHQEVALKNAGCDKIFLDTISGAVSDRPGLSEMMDFVRPQDTVVVYRLDRLGRSLQDLIIVVNLLATKDISLCSLHENLDTSTAGGKLIFHIFGALSQFERELIKERTKSGLEAARLRGRIGGRPSKLSKNEEVLIKKLFSTNEFSSSDLCKKFGISKATFYRTINES